MRANPITLCLFTTTKGHFGRTDIYQTTVRGLLSQVPRESWGRMVAHIQDSGERPGVTDILPWLVEQGFEVMTTAGQWAHFDQSHQDNYVRGVTKVLATVTTPYVMIQEDDWNLKCYDRELEYWLHEATALLDQNPDLMQVRIPRFSNEDERIKRLMTKHGIDGRVQWSEDHKWLFHNDFSMNPHIARTRDLRAALALVRISILPKHIEHGTGQALKLLSGASLPFVCPDPARIRAAHLGTKTPEEADDLTKPLIAD